MKLRNLAFWAGLASMASLTAHAGDLKEISFLAGGSTLNVSYPNDTLPLTLGYWEKEGLNVTVIPGHGTLEGAQQIVGGGIQFAEGDAAGIIQAIDKNKLPIKATITYEVNGWSFVVPEDADMTGPEWFEGKRLGVYSLSSGSLPLFKAYMSENDLDSVELIPLGYGAPVIKAMNDGEVDAVLQWVTFRLANETYGINVMQVQEVLRFTDIAPVPGAPPYVLGIINLRGNVVTVIDTRARFGLPPTEITDNTRIVIIESDEQVVGILVDSVAEVVYLKSSEIDSAPNVGTEESAKFIQGVSNRDGELLILVDLNKLLSDEEWDELSNI